MKQEIEIKGKTLEVGQQVQNRYGITRVTLYRWAKRGLIPQPLLIGGRNFYDREAVEARIAEGETRVSKSVPVSGVGDAPVTLCAACSEAD